jgi:prolyl oligopeptidase
LIAEWQRLDKMQPPYISAPDYIKGRLFYLKTMPGEDVAKLYYRDSLKGKEQLLFDPLSYIPGRKLSVYSTLPSRDGKKIVIAYTDVGKEVCTIKVMNVDSKTFYSEEIYPVWFGAQSWTYDHEYFHYFSPVFTEGGSEPMKKNKIHHVGTSPDKDFEYFSKEHNPELNIGDSEQPFVYLRWDYLLAYLSNVRKEYFVYYAPASEYNNAKINWKPLCTPDDGLVRGLNIIGDKLYAITYKGAPNYRLISTDIKNPDWKNAKTVIPEHKYYTLESMTYTKDFLILKYSDGINHRLYKYDLKTGKMTEVKLPYAGSVYLYCFEWETNHCYVGISSWNKPYTEFKFMADTETFSPSDFNPPPVYPKEYMELEVKEVEVKGHDGAMIPLSIIYKKGTKLDGNNVCLMETYGAYGRSMTPTFDDMKNSLAVKGVVIAIPHVRGGSEKGDTWYKSGYKTTKANSWKDFISCTEYLIKKGYTSPKKIAIKGMSAGGIVISRAITDRPDLYAAAICDVPLTNAMRMEVTYNGPANIPEFGTLKDSAECRALYEMDGMLHVTEGVKYPAVICVAGANDPKITLWEPGKFAAALQNTSTSGKPVLMKVNYDNAHYTEDKSLNYANYADQLAFAMWQCGHPAFQLKK